LAVMPRNWALVGIGVHDFGQRFAPRAYSSELQAYRDITRARASSLHICAL